MSIQQKENFTFFAMLSNAKHLGFELENRFFTALRSVQNDSQFIPLWALKTVELSIGTLYILPQVCDFIKI